MNSLSNRAAIHQWVFVGLLVLTVIGMQFSHFLVSSSIIFMSANFLLEGQFVEKWNRIKKHKTISLFVGLFLLHILALLWSTDFDFAAHDIQIKLPLLALPLVIGSSNKITTKQFEWLLLFFIATSLTSSLVGSVIYFILSQPGDDYRNMSPFMSHIRLSLMMGVAMYASFYLSQKSKQFQNYKGWFIGLAIWFLVYLFMLRAMSGIVAVMASIFILLWILSSERKIKYSNTIKLIIIGSITLVGGYIAWHVNQFYQIQEIDLATTDTHTKSGEQYYFDLSIPLVENGNYVYSYIARNELKKEWNTESKYDFEGNDERGQNLESTLLRYLSSKGFRKDKEGVQALTHLDVWAIENGIANVRFLDDKNLNTMIYRYIWEIHNFNHGFNPQGNSLGQRFLFWRIGLKIFKENIWTGVGTGDVQVAYNEQYTALPFTIDPKYQLRAHNQYLTMAITFGVFGIIYFVITLFSGLQVLPYAKSYLFLGFFVILMVSMLDEDTLETQFGVTFAAYFYFLFLFQQPEKE